MRHFCISEYGRIPRSDVPPRCLKQFQRLDETRSKQEMAGVFDWSRLQYIRATSYVGVVQVPGMAIEVLPKIDDSTSTVPLAPDDPCRQRAQGNLLYMLSLTRDLPLEERDLADQKLRRLPLLEMLIRIFLVKLLTELRRGRDKAYLYREENLPVLKGKLLATDHVRMNAGRHERFYVGYDEFLADTSLNRIMKATCRRLLEISTHVVNQQLAREVILEFADVEDIQVNLEHFKRVQLTRNSERFRLLLNFCQLVLIEATPQPSVGGTNTFTLLFPMDQLFEEFIGSFVQRYANQLGTHRDAVHIQAVRRHHWLLETDQGHGRFRLQPDVIVEHEHRKTRLILDTKWKRLKRDTGDPRNGVSQADIYQLFAYANRYVSPDNVLLYPKVSGVTAKAYCLQEDALQRKIRVEFIDLNRDLAVERKAFLAEMQRILGLGIDKVLQSQVAQTMSPQ